MEVRKGYKQTEVGMIPEDWEVKQFGEVVNYIKGYPFKSKDYKQSGIRIIRVSDTTFDSIKKDNAIYVDEKRINEFRNWRLFDYDLIFSTVGSKPPMYDSMVGKVILIKKEDSGALLNQNAVLIRAKNKTEFLQQLLLNHFRSKRYLQHIEEIFRGNANQASITLEDLFKYLIPLPPTKSEQTAIATALSDADALITSLEKLIEKKRAIKQGAMQELLTPKEGWEVKRLGEVAEIIGGGTPSTYVTHYWNGTINWYTPTEIGMNKYTYESQRKLTKEGLSNCSARILPIGTILLTSRAGIGDLSILMREGCTNQGFQSMITKNGYSNEYLYYLMQTLKNELLKNASGSTFLEISPNKIKQIEVSVPNFVEQTRIATLLSDMDAEITAFEQKLSKYKLVKLGMMQELLTGRIRLVENV